MKKRTGETELRQKSTRRQNAPTAEARAAAKEKRNRKLTRALFWFVFASILLSLTSAVVSIILAPAEVSPSEPEMPVKSDYTLVVFQGVCGILALFLPSLLERRANFRISGFLYIFYILFLYCAIYLGEMSNFFYRFPHWDTLLHTTSGALIGAIGFSVVDILNRDRRNSIKLSPVFVAVFAFAFALSVGTLWEIFEYAADGILGVNMQKHTLENGTALVGRAALQDTMEDFIVDAAGALFMCIVGYIGLRTGRSDMGDAIRVEAAPQAEKSRQTGDSDGNGSVAKNADDC